ncbi:TIGR02710 family CRISPR-associated CARF protein [Candidatus Binatia bacterium]|nr:TIGR02710 family CRISPR-associated CARF protein [Candidatus Binatia bacterium]
MARAMIVSVGGSAEPLAVTLGEEKPEFVCFLASHRSVDEIAKIKDAVKVSTGGAFKDEKEIVDSAEDLVECYRKALACIERVRRQGFPESEMLIDYTGGTKVMSAAVAMAAAAYGVRFSYVGGDRRTKDGLGVVESGSERRRIDRNPLELFAVEEKRRIAQHFNSHQYDAAAVMMGDLLPKLQEPHRALLDAVRDLLVGYAAWDRFDHRTARRELGKGRHRLEELVRAAQAGEYSNVLSQAAENVRFLESLDRDTNGFHNLRMPLVGDLVANAERRLAERKYDDAVARLYRAIEMRGQIAFEAEFAHPTNKVPPTVLPERVRAEYVSRYAAADKGLLKLPLEATYRALAAVDDAVGKEFVARYEEVSQLQGARNDSILAHGIQPMGKERAARMLDLTLAFLPSTVHRPEFPRLPW